MGTRTLIRRDGTSGERVDGGFKERCSNCCRCKPVDRRSAKSPLCAPDRRMAAKGRSCAAQRVVLLRLALIKLASWSLDPSRAFQIKAEPVLIGVRCAVGTILDM